MACGDFVTGEDARMLLLRYPLKKCKSRRARMSILRYLAETKELRENNAKSRENRGRH